MIVVSFRESTVAALGCVHFMPFVSLELPHIADIDPKVDCDSRRASVLYFSQTRYGLFISSLTFGLPLSVINRRCSLALLSIFGWRYSTRT
jgi:hypothetical protein